MKKSKSTIKGVQMTNGRGVYDLLVSYRSGDIYAPKIETDGGAEGPSLNTSLTAY